MIRSLLCVIHGEGRSSIDDRYRLCAAFTNCHHRPVDSPTCRVSLLLQPHLGSSQYGIRCARASASESDPKPAIRPDAPPWRRALPGPIAPARLLGEQHHRYCTCCVWQPVPNGWTTYPWMMAVRRQLLKWCSPDVQMRCCPTSRPRSATRSMIDRYGGHTISRAAAPGRKLLRRFWSNISTQRSPNAVRRWVGSGLIRTGPRPPASALERPLERSNRAASRCELMSYEYGGILRIDSMFHPGPDGPAVRCPSSGGSGSRGVLWCSRGSFGRSAAAWAVFGTISCFKGELA